MAITAEQRQERRGWVGSSDAPAIAGVDSWRSPVAVFLEKVFDIEDLPNKGPIARGNRYESVLLDWAQEELGVEIERNVSARHPADLICAANLDGRFLRNGGRFGVEAKVTSLGSEFGEPYSDDIPDRILVQTAHQMYVDNLDGVYVPVLLARFDRPQEEMFFVERDEDLIAAVVAKNHAFWEGHVLPRIPPPLDGLPALDVIKRIRRTEGAVVPVDPVLVEAWEAAKINQKLAENQEKAAKSALLAALGDAEIGDYGDGRQWLTYFEQNRAGYTVKPTSFRVARLQKRT